MELMKYSPWNWLEREQQRPGISPARFLGRNPETLFDRMFADVVDSCCDRSIMADKASGAERLLIPDIDIRETDDAYLVNLEVPGVDEKDISLVVTGKTLVMSGEKKLEEEKEDENFHRIERQFGTFRRTLELPPDVDHEAIKAEFDKGVLKISIPRRPHQETSSRKIDILPLG